MSQSRHSGQSDDSRWSLFEHLPDALIVCNASGQITRLNAQAETMLGYSRRELIGQPVEQLLPEPLRLAHASHRARYCTAPKLRPMGVGKDLYARRKDGSEIPVDISLNPVWQNGELQVVSIVRDISERKQLERSIRESQRTLVTLMANLPGMAYRRNNDPDWTLQFASDGCLELTGYSAADFVQNRTVSYGHLIHPEDRSRVWNEVQSALAQKKPFEIVYRISTARDEQKWVWEKGVGIFSPDKKIQALEGFITDITEQKQNERAFQRKNAQLEALVGILSHYLATGDWHGAYKLLVDEALHQTDSEYGFAGVITEDKALRILAHSGMTWDATENRAFYEEALRKYREVGYLEFTNFDNLFGCVITGGRPVISNDPSKDPRSRGLPAGHPPLRSFLGVPLLTRFEAVGLLAVANRPGGYDSVAQRELEVLACSASVLFDSYRRYQHETDMKIERDRARQSLEDYAGRLKNLSGQLLVSQESARRRFARELHDEIGQGLTGVKLMLEAVAMQGDGDANKDLAAPLALINELLEKTRDLTFQLRPPILDDLGLVPALAWHIHRFSEQTHIHIDFIHNSPEKRLPAEIETAAYRIVQEALTNVARHAHATKATVRLSETPEAVFVEIEDRGRGFDPEAVLQGHHGSGLSGMHERVSLLGGQLTIDSTPQSGTCITAEIPLPDRASTSAATGQTDADHE